MFGHLELVLMII